MLAPPGWRAPSKLGSPATPPGLPPATPLHPMQVDQLLLVQLIEAKLPELYSHLQASLCMHRGATVKGSLAFVHNPVSLLAWCCCGDAGRRMRRVKLR